jgi:uncharacterized membrane protein (DUF485 family)
MPLSAAPEYTSIPDERSNALRQGGPMQNETSPPPTGGIDYVEFEESADFKELKKRQRSFVFPLSIFFLVWYGAYIIVAAYAHDFMATPVFGNINVGLLLGIGQFVTTFAITMWYVSYANRRLDPLANDLRVQLTKEDQA